jgi:hypothetical protein
MPTTRTGDWALARTLLGALPAQLKASVQVALRQEAHQLRNEIVEGLTKQAPGGQTLEPPSELTVAKRQLTGHEGTKSLLVQGDLRNSVGVVVRGDSAFVGIARQARSRAGTALVDVAKVQEFGSRPIAIPITPKMRRFLFALLRRVGKVPERGAGATAGVAVVQVPARPFLRPAFERFKVGASRRFLDRVARLLHLGGGP